MHLRQAEKTVLASVECAKMLKEEEGPAGWQNLWEDIQGLRQFSGGVFFFGVLQTVTKHVFPE